MRSRMMFASYSRQDKAYVIPLCELLRAGGTRVFRDEDDIKPGEKWQVVLTRRLEKADGVFVFWTSNAAASRWMKREYSTGIKMKKDVIPVLLDSTPLCAELSEFMWIDLRHSKAFLPWIKHDWYAPSLERLVGCLQILPHAVWIIACIASILTALATSVPWLPACIFVVGFIIGACLVFLKMHIETTSRREPEIFRVHSVVDGSSAAHNREVFEQEMRELFAKRIFENDPPIVG